MTSGSVGLARGILRNAAALFLVGLLAKGMGLVIAILIARFLGADAMGLFALLFAIAVVLETFISVGMSDSLVRDVAARPSMASNLYLHALRLVSWISLVPAVALALAAFLIADEGSMRASLVIVAIGAPVSAAFVVSQAVLQGSERILFLTWVTFLARVVSLIWLAFALYRGAGVEAAFVSRLLFQAGSVAVFFAALWRDRNEETTDFAPRTQLTRSLPFALNRGIREISVRLPSLVLPGTVGLAPAGLFDSANRIRSTLGMTMSAMIVGMMPSFSRNFADSDSNSGQLVGYSVKYMCLAMSAVATVISLGGEWIISLLFGVSFSGAAQLLEILVWVQVLVAVDAVLQQAMLAAGYEYTAVRYSSVGVAGQLVLILPLAYVLGLEGAALAVLLSSALTLILDLRFVVRNVVAIPVGRFATGPLAAACLVAVMILAVHDQPFVVRVLVAICSWGVATAVFRLLPREEIRFMRQLVSLPRAKRAANLDRDK